jgi:hypothetical protein
MNVISNWLAGRSHKSLNHSKDSSFRKGTLEKKIMGRHDSIAIPNTKRRKGRNRKALALWFRDCTLGWKHIYIKIMHSEITESNQDGSEEQGKG